MRASYVIVLCLGLGACEIENDQGQQRASASFVELASTCGLDEHECLCATGGFCVPLGVQCPQQPDSACPAPGCEREITCVCATGTYCLPVGALCLRPDSACPR